MAHIARRNIIVSHGGLHGPSSRTHRVGQAVPDKDVGLIPRDMQAVDEEPPLPVPGPKPKAAVKAPPAPAPQAPAEVTMDDGPPELAPDGSRQMHVDPSANGDRTGTTEVVASAAVADKPLAEGWVPRTKKDVHLLKKDQTEELARRMGLSVAEDAKGRTQLLKDMIQAKLGL